MSFEVKTHYFYNWYSGSGSEFDLCSSCTCQRSSSICRQVGPFLSDGIASTVLYSLTFFSYSCNERLTFFVINRLFQYYLLSLYIPPLGGLQYKSFF